MSSNSLMKAPQPAEKNKPIKVCIVLYYIVLFYARWQCGVSYEYRMYQSGPSSVNTNLVSWRYGYGGSLLQGQNTVQIYIIQCRVECRYPAGKSSHVGGKCFSSTDWHSDHTQHQARSLYQPLCHCSDIYRYTLPPSQSRKYFDDLVLTKIRSEKMRLSAIQILLIYRVRFISVFQRLQIQVETSLVWFCLSGDFIQL